MLVKRCLVNAARQCHNCVLEVVMTSSSLPDLSLSLQEGALPARWTHRGRWAGIYVALRFTETPPLSAGWALEGAPALSSCVSQNFPYYKVRYRVISPRYSLQGNNLEGREWRITYEGRKKNKKRDPFRIHAGEGRASLSAQKSQLLDFSAAPFLYINPLKWTLCNLSNLLISWWDFPGAYFWKGLLGWSLPLRTFWLLIS